MKTYSQLIAETDSRMYGDDAVVKGKPKPPCKNCDKKKPKPFMGYEEVEPMKDDPCWDGYRMLGTKQKNGRTVPNCIPVGKKDESQPVSEQASGKGEAMRCIADWKDKMKMVEDHIKFLQDKRLGGMREKLKTAEKKLEQGDYGWISRELFFNGDLF